MKHGGILFKISFVLAVHGRDFEKKYLLTYIYMDSVLKDLSHFYGFRVESGCEILCSLGEIIGNLEK